MRAHKSAPLSGGASAVAPEHPESYPPTHPHATAGFRKRLAAKPARHAGRHVVVAVLALDGLRRVAGTFQIGEALP